MCALPGLCKRHEGNLGVFSLSLVVPSPWVSRKNSAVCADKVFRA